MKIKDLSLVIALGATSLFFAPSAVADPTPEELIDQLTKIDCNAPGLYNYFPFGDFWAVVPDRDSKVHLEGRRPDCVPQAMRALVRLGPSALPALVRHIGDQRPTELKIGSKEDPNKVTIGGQVFAEAYDPRAHSYNDESLTSRFLDKCKELDCWTERGFQEPYTLRVGDVCLTLIGQIVNRPVDTAYYQMTGFVIVNSPVETPSLADRVRADWASTDAEGLEKSLLADLHMPLRPPPPGYKSPRDSATTYQDRESDALQDLQRGALRRLRFYFPETYESLSGDDLAKRQRFEKWEIENNGPYPSPDLEELIDDLTSLNCPIPGLSETGTFNGFIAQESSLQTVSTVLFEQHGTLRIPEFCNNTSVQNIMHFGLAVLPSLIQHLGDKRLTKLVIGQDSNSRLETFGGQFFADEYDARHQTWPLVQCLTDVLCEHAKPSDKPYTVRVGDICFVLIGQIVNRRLSAVRYQPTAIVRINSPIEAPLLADRVRRDWAGISNEELKNSLLADLRAKKLEGAPDSNTETQALENVHSGALLRLRYYFPDTYASLSGTDLEARNAFEKAERANLRN